MEENLIYPENGNGSIDDKIDVLVRQIASLQLEKRKIEEEFGVQRAKMKDLFLQKENEFKQQLFDQDEKYKEEVKKLQTELDDLRSQLTVSSLDFQSQLEAETRKYKDELSSLQHILSETAEESSKFVDEIKRLNHLNLKLEAEVNDLKGVAGHSGADMPQILSVPQTMITSLARKVTNITNLGNSDNSGSSNGSPNVGGALASLSQFSESDSLDDSMRKAQEDAAVLRSLVVPLEEEIRALKEKIREMDTELRKYQIVETKTSLLDDNVKSINVSEMIDVGDENSLLAVIPVKSTDSLLDVSPGEVKAPSIHGCDMCSNYEAQLLNAKQEIHNLEKHIVSLGRYKQELSKETALRKDLEEKWNEKKEEYKEEVKTLQAKTEKAEETLKELRKTYTNTYEDITRELERLLIDRENNQKELYRLEEENNNLVGKHHKNSQQLQNEVINLPSSVEELHELILRNQEDLIAAKIAQERANEMVAMLKEEIVNLREHSNMQELARRELENALIESMKKLRNDPQLMGGKVNSENEDHERGDIRQEIRQFSSNLDKLAKSKKYFEENVNELRSRVSSLQTELDNSEKVQKDFVLLSQSLQQELEKIRAAENEVRWEHDEDVTECRRCKAPFSVTKRKVHCRHCGRIYCQSCLIRTVNSGPNSRPSKVCDVCHTLLDRESAPYFSKDPPQGD